MTLPKARYVGSSKLVPPPPRVAGTCKAGTPKVVGTSRLLDEPRQPSVAIAASTDGLLVAWSTAGAELPKPELVVRMLDRDGEPRGASRQYALRSVDRLTAAALVDGWFVVFVGGFDNGGLLELVTLDASGALVEPVAEQRLDGRAPAHVLPAVADESGAVSIAWLLEPGTGGAHYFLDKAVFQNGAAATLRSERVANEKFPDLGRGTRVHLGREGDAVIDWNGRAWELGAGNLSFTPPDGTSPTRVSFGYDPDGALIATTSATYNGGTIAGWRRPPGTDTWGAADLAADGFRDASATGFRIEDAGKQGGIRLVYAGAKPQEVPVVTVAVPEGRSSVAWTGEKFFAAFPILDGDAYAIYVSPITCSDG